MITLSRLYVYPVKSCRGIELARSQITSTGLQHDREWLIVTPSGRFITQREAPRLALIEPAIDAGNLTLRAPGMAPLEVHPGDYARTPVQVTIWRDHCKAFDAGRDAAQWLEQFLGRPVRLVRFDTSQPRLVDPEWSGDVPGYSKFSDGYPVLVISNASLAELNTRLEKPLPMERFRPNLVLEGCEPYAEDSMRTIELDGVQLQLVKPCTRCVITTTDQQTGQRDGVEPLQTLKSYRWDAQLKGVAFGQNAIVVAGAGRELATGMAVNQVTFDQSSGVR